MATDFLKWCALFKSGSVTVAEWKATTNCHSFHVLLADEEQEAELCNTDRTQQQEITSKEMREGKL